VRSNFQRAEDVADLRVKRGELVPIPGWVPRGGCLGRGVGCEIMDTAAACRCYNVLLAESRSVAAALFSIREEHWTPAFMPDGS
jgi:uncharacterized protein